MKLSVGCGDGKGGRRVVFHDVKRMKDWWKHDGSAWLLTFDGRWRGVDYFERCCWAEEEKGFGVCFR